jgi:hypothetical protein
MISAQLSLFDTATAQVNSFYKPGDCVQLKRKSKNAAYIKKGDIVQVKAVHPVNGSIKFWNEHTQRYDFLYPEEIKLTVEPVVGEISEVTVESVVGEISEVTVESVVGEVKTPKNYWNCDKGYSSNGWLESHYKIRVNSRQRSIKRPEMRCTGSYYSYRWMEGKRQRAKYCPASKCPAVRRALSLGEPVNEILKIISCQ